MIIVFGILSLFQLTFIPGLIVTRLCKIQGFFQNILLTLGISPIVNYLFVFIMTSLGIYTRLTLIIFIGIEFLILFIVLIPVFKNYTFINKLKFFLKNFIRDYFNSEKIEKGKGYRVIQLLVFLFALGILLFYLVYYASQYSSVFTTWDAVVSWNKWAVEWFTNHIPLGTSLYPQLIPANFSMTYQLINDERVQFFAKYFMGLIEIFVIFTIFVIGVLKRKMVFFIAVIITGWLQFVLGSQGSGYVDTPVSYWALLSITCLILARNNKDQMKYILLGALFAAGSAVTKQVGLWIAIIYPILLVLLNREKKLAVNKSSYFYILLIYFGILVPWYGFSLFQIISGSTSSNISYLINLASQGKSIIDMIFSGFMLLCEHLSKNYSAGIVELIILLVLIISSLWHKWCRKIVTLIILPMFLAWLFFFSYDIRNINIIVPFVGISASVGMGKIISWIYEKVSIISNKHKTQNKISLFFRAISSKYNINERFKKVSFLFPLFVIFILIPLSLILVLPGKYSDSYLISKSINAQRQMGDRLFVQKLYEFFSNSKIEGQILTDYQYIGFLPELKEYYEYGYPNSEVFIQQLGDPKNAYAVVSLSNMSQEVRKYIDQLVNKNKISVLLQYGDYMLYSTCGGPCQ